MNNGKQFEKLVRLIQEALKDVSNTEIFSNYKIENTSGRKREIDVLIKSMINNFEILIAIECKDYKDSVSVEKIEAFNSKYQRIKGISKKIFISANGYQADAIEAAKDFDIELFQLNEIKTPDIIQWFSFSIMELKSRYLLKCPHRIMFNVENIQLNGISEDEDLIIYSYDNRDPITLTGFLWNATVYEFQNEWKSLLLYDFIKNGNLNYQTIIPYKLNCSGIYIKGKNNRKIDNAN